MATRTWSGTAGDGNFATTANWGGTVPVTGDTVIISATATSGITSGLDRSADGAGAGLNVVSWTIQKGFAYDIGTSTSPLRMTADKFVDNGNGAVYFETDTGTAALNTDRVIIDKENPNKEVYLMGSGTSVMTLIEVARGMNVYLADGIFSGVAQNIATLWIVPRNTYDVRVFGVNTGGVVTTTYMSGGEFLVDGVAPTTIFMSDGVLEFRQDGITTFNQGGGIFLHNGEAGNLGPTTYNAMKGSMRSTDTSGGKFISTLNRAPQWDMDYNPDLTVNTTNYIGG